MTVTLLLSNTLQGDTTMSTPPIRPTVTQYPPLEVPADLEIEYVNLVRIAHSPSELVFDFAQLLPGAGQANVCSRIIMSPLGAKLFHRALSENLARYESAFGEIKIPGDSTLADHLFRPTPPAPDKPNPEKST
jgi:hypothetical protein